MRVLVLLSSLILLAAPALAQRPAPRALPADPAPAAPAPPILSDTPARSPTPPPRPVPPVVLAPGMENLPGGGWRLLGDAAARERLDPAAISALAEIASHLAERTQGRVTILAEAAGPARDASAARRATLAAGRQVKRALETGGLDGTRIDIRPLGRLAEARDAVTILPPGVQAVR